MKIGILGTGTVGRGLGTKLRAAGHEVILGSRNRGHEGALQWAAQTGGATGTFADAAAEAELLFLCTEGQHALTVLASIESKHLEGKVLVDVTNPLDFSRGMPPTLFVSNTDSLGEQIQRACPARVVKALNTLTADLMLAPELLPEPTAVFVSGNDPAARSVVVALLRSFGWQQVVELGDITTARGTEAWLALWIRLWGATGSARFNLRLVQAG